MLTKKVLGFEIRQWIALSIIVVGAGWAVNKLHEMYTSAVTKAVAPAESAPATETTPV
jgi:hypothetical protein